MTPVGFQVGDIAVVVEGAVGDASATAFAPTGTATLKLKMVPTTEPLRPAGPPRAERDSWVAFSDGETVSLALKIPEYTPCEIARVDLPAAGLEGTLLHSPAIRVHSIGYPLDQLLLMHALTLRDGALMHGAAIAGPEGAYLAFGPSGAGKTTLARAAAELPGARVLSDERTVVRREGERWVLDGTPWYGEGEFAERATVPLAGLLWLEKAERDRLMPLTPARALARLFKCCFVPFWNDAGAARTLDHLERLVREVPAFTLENRRGPDAARMILARVGA